MLLGLKQGHQGGGGSRCGPGGTGVDGRGVCGGRSQTSHSHRHMAASVLSARRPLIIPKYLTLPLSARYQVYE